MKKGVVESGVLLAAALALLLGACSLVDVEPKTFDVAWLKLKRVAGTDSIWVQSAMRTTEASRLYPGVYRLELVVGGGKASAPTEPTPLQEAKWSLDCTEKQCPRLDLNPPQLTISDSVATPFKVTAKHRALEATFWMAVHK